MSPAAPTAPTAATTILTAQIYGMAAPGTPTPPPGDPFTKEGMTTAVLY